MTTAGLLPTTLPSASVATTARWIVQVPVGTSRSKLPAPAGVWVVSARRGLLLAMPHSVMVAAAELVGAPYSQWIVRSSARAQARLSTSGGGILPTPATLLRARALPSGPSTIRT